MTRRTFQVAAADGQHRSRCQAPFSWMGLVLWFLTMLIVGGQTAQAVDGTWNVDADGYWGTSTNWLNGNIAGGIGSVADFSALDFDAHNTVSLTSHTTVGTLIFGDEPAHPDSGWTVVRDVEANGWNLILDAGGSNTPTINKATLNAPATLSVGLVGTQGFNKLGKGELILTQANAGLSGTVTVDGGTLQLSGANGALSGVTAITINSGADLELDETVAFHGNRLPDNALITMNGGTLKWTPKQNTSLTETIGGIRLGPGYSTIRIDHISDLQRVLTVSGGLLRTDLTAMLMFRVEGTTSPFLDLGQATSSSARVIIPNYDVDPNIAGVQAGFMGGWAVATDNSDVLDFAYYQNDSLGVTALGTLSGVRATTLTVSGADVSFTGNQTLDADRSIRSLAVNGTASANLGGHTLTIASGGILGGGYQGGTAGNKVISTGQLTAGSGDPLYPYVLWVQALAASNGPIEISANIIDNTDSGTHAVTVVKGGSSTGVLTLSGNNSYSGGTYVNSGELSLAAANAAGTGDVTVLGGFLSIRANNALSSSATIYLGDAVSGGDALVQIGTTGISLTNSIVVRGGANDVIRIGAPNVDNVTFSGNITLNNHLTLIEDVSSFQSTISGRISESGGPFGITKTGIGTVILTNTGNAWSGSTIIDEGTLKIGAAGALPSDANLIFKNRTVFSVARLDLSGVGSQTVASLSSELSASTGITLAGTLLTVNNDSDTTYRGTISATGAGGLIKTGSGKLVLTGANTFTTTTGVTIAAGVLRAVDNSALGSAASANTLPVQVNGGARLEVDNVTLNNGLQITLQNGAELRGIGTAGSNGRVAVASGATVTVSTAASTDVLTLGNSPNTNDVTGDAASQIVIAGPGKVVVATSNSAFLGSWVINAGTLQANATTSALGNTLTATVTVNSGGTLIANSGVTVGNALTLNGGTLATIGSGTFSGAMTLAPGSTNTFSTSVTLTISGALQGTGGIVKSGTGTLVLASTANNYSGITNISGGTLRAGAANVFSPNSAVTLGNVSGVTLSLNGFNQTIAALSGGGTIGGTVSLGAVTLTVGNASNTTFSGTLTGTGGKLVKVGDGILNLAESNSYTGTTTVSAGTLAINGSIVGSVVVQSGGTLHGNGTIGGTVTVEEGATFSPGNSVGQINTGSQTWNSGSNEVFEILDATGAAGTEWDLITISGTLSLSATPASRINLQIESWLDDNSIAGTPLADFNPASAYSWLWVTTTGGILHGAYDVNGLFDISVGPEFDSAFPSTFADLFSVELSEDGLSLLVSYNGVPEPSSLLLASLAVGGMGLYRRRIRRMSLPTYLS